jgi:hypothetical protein
MTDGLLENIIQLEKHIQLEVTAERALADEWQQRELAAIESSFATDLNAEEERCRQILAEEKTALQSEGADLEATSSAWCQRLSTLDDLILCDVLKRHLATILPGGDHDHPHGQS